ncbi:hypothetical protein OH76DRAFT_1357752 [Lentinus brumalis]|uniref:DUF6570 domain-containing protein n=1 Tax=Lentinus brumalis TaxID=2498619 RepID=A0A371CZ00_9APHY|nr:hypothetical protein OH76DRAFT_1357752 [Polyporus brumalis]
MQKLRDNRKSRVDELVTDILSTNKPTRKFLPHPLTEDSLYQTISGYTNDVQVQNFLESGCAVCGLLTTKSCLHKLHTVAFDRNLLVPDTPITRVERRCASDHILSQPGSVLLPHCNDICVECMDNLQTGKLPADSLANGLWIGEVPSELQGLSWTENMLISRVKHNYCIVKVHLSGMSKMKANVVSHSLPMAKVYQALPPTREELSKVLAFMYIGPNVPTQKEFQRTPLLVRRNKVAMALEWLKLNHADYADLEILYKNLSEYPPLVVVNFTQSMGSNKDPESTAVNDDEEDEGTE